MIKDITFEECLPLWQQLWPTGEIVKVSSMRFTANALRLYGSGMGDPTFIGYYDNGYLLGVNSYHTIDGNVRSRGLFVTPEARGKGIGKLLLEETIRRAGDKHCWSFPKKEALSCYLRAGFTQWSEVFYDRHEDKFNCYVSTRPHKS